MQHVKIVQHLETICKALENDTGATWKIDDFHPCYDIETWSDAGENVIIPLLGKTLEKLADDAESAARNFDAEEHAAKIFLAKRTGDEDERRFYEAAPDSLYALLKDAEQIHGFYRALAAMLKVEAEKAKKARRV